MGVREELARVFELTNAHNMWRLRETINLIASENVMSPAAMAVYVSDPMHRYAEGKPFKRHYQGVKYIDELEVLANELMGRLFETDMVDLRPVSGTIANAATFRVLAQPGDKAVIAPVQAGAHVSHTKFGTLGALGIQQVDLPYDEERMNVDVDRAIKVIEEVKPKFAVLGGSVYLFPHPVKEIAEAVHSVGGKLVYDAAHVLGLIAGGAWENPLKHGADVMTASTHKTFPGPQGGVILASNREVFKEISKTIFPWFVSNHHLHRLPATAVTALEMLEFGRQYADQVIRNAKRLAEALAERGFTVLAEHMGYTMSHQVLLDVTKQGGGAKAALLLEEANIIVNKNLLPKDPPEAVKNPSGLRIGVQEMTRFGMKEDEMEVIADFMERVLIKGEEPSKVREEVKSFRSNFTKVHYGFRLEDLSGVVYSNALSLLE
ncbi:MAG: serine hydroxymethyltransferase [Acidilobus sp.]|nr:serine hydroxymethyltransferase [Acidilobus sp.]MCG2889670.1 serine hydroxymethyltransferase [Acidilobus sp.]MCG2890588.1 serine hydroxymethyltransferase [Acidilobus sp.]